MLVRIVKIGLVLSVALQALFYGLQNIANYDGAYGFMAYILSMEGHEAYPQTFFFSITNPAAVTALLWIIIAAEISAGLLGLYGAARMGLALGAPVETFASAQNAAVLSAGLAVVIWFGLFMGFAGAFFQMWQTDPGLGALEGAFMYAMTSGIVLIVLLLPEARKRPG